MKRIGIALTILLLLAGFSGWHVLSLSNFTKELTDLLVQAEHQVSRENWAGAETLTRQALVTWQSRDFYLHATMRHEDTDTILAGFHQVLAYLEGKEHQPSEYAAANAQLITAIELLAEAEIPTPKNIL